MNRRILTLAAAALALAVSAAPVAAGGPPHTAFYVDGDLYQTVGTPSNFFDTGAPLSTYDKLYAIDEQSYAVAEAAPGDTDYNGGRWLRFHVSWNVDPYLLTSEEDVLAAEMAGDVTIADEPDASFDCPVIPLH